jgi:DNA-binding NarL/FixJ family response regulator
MTNVSIIEDDDFFIEKIKALIESSDGLQLLSFHTDFEDFIDYTKTAKTLPNILITDIGLPGINGIEGTLYVTTNHPMIDVIILTVFNDTGNLFEALKAGAISYLLKTAKDEEIIETIQTVLNGGSTMNQFIARKVMNYFHTVESKKNDFLSNLSEREQEVIECMMEGLSYKEAAEKLFLSVDTIRFHIKNLYKKLNVNSKSEMISKYGKYFKS